MGHLWSPSYLWTGSYLCHTPVLEGGRRREVARIKDRRLRGTAVLLATLDSGEHAAFIFGTPGDKPLLGGRDLGGCQPTPTEACQHPGPEQCVT